MIFYASADNMCMLISHSISLPSLVSFARGIYTSLVDTRLYRHLFSFSDNKYSTYEHKYMKQKLFVKIEFQFVDNAREGRKKAKEEEIGKRKR